ncbi:MAG: D-alanyl-D-alanine carboxypeptidase/D-alanyl-D-alanine-endopeptidase [Phycisphaerae bacterium]
MIGPIRQPAVRNPRFTTALVFFVPFVVSSVCLAAAPPQARPIPLAQRVADMAAKVQNGKGQVGISAVSLADDKPIIAIDASEPLIPASNQKVLTSAVALATLGGEYKFTTQVYQQDRDVVLVGDYDPTLGDPVLAAAAKQDIYVELDKWAKAIKARMDKVESVLVCVPPGRAYRNADWPASQQTHWYAAPVAALDFNNNCFDVTFKVEKGVVEAAVSPASRFIAVRNKVKAGKRDVWSLDTTEDSVVLTGSVIKSSSQPVSVAFNNPPMVLARVLADRMVRAGVEFGGKFGQVEKLAGGDPLLASTQTPLAAVMARANKRSLNMAAECIFLRCCGDWETGPAKATEILTKTYELPAEGFHIADGSGLSRKNTVSPAAMTKLLAALAKRKDAKVFIDSLPIAGVDGTLEKRMTAEPYKGRVLAKTGYIAGVSCLSGYVLDGDKRPAVAFSVMVNHIAGAGDAKALENGVAEALVDSLTK